MGACSSCCDTEAWAEDLRAEEPLCTPLPQSSVRRIGRRTGATIVRPTNEESPPRLCLSRTSRSKDDTRPWHAAMRHWAASLRDPKRAEDTPVEQEPVVEFGDSVLLQCPTPDFSMPYNVITMTCTVLALFFGRSCVPAAPPLCPLVPRHMCTRSRAGLLALRMRVVRMRGD